LHQRHGGKARAIRLAHRIVPQLQILIAPFATPHNFSGDVSMKGLFGRSQDGRNPHH
jgi:hypothetical protein